MGLTDDLYNAFVNNMSDTETETTELTDFQKKKAMDLAENVKEAFIDFLTAQKFTIRKMKAALEVENIKTSSPLKGNVEKTVGVAPGIPTVGTPAAQQTVAVGFIEPTTGINGVTVPKLDLSSGTTTYGGSQGGMLQSYGHAYIGDESPNSEKNNSTGDNEVTINREDIVKE